MKPDLSRHEDPWIAEVAVERLANAGTDGIAMLLADRVDRHVRRCRVRTVAQVSLCHLREALHTGYSNHGLYVCRKR
jgi:hypothetical protein